MLTSNLWLCKEAGGTCQARDEHGLRVRLRVTFGFKSS